MLLREQYKKPVEVIKIGDVTSDFAKAVAEAGLVKEVLNLGIIPRSSLLNPCDSVDVLLFPSLYEGFGWVPLEATARGTPILASDVASLPEVIDNAGLKCSPLDTDGLADAGETIFDNPELRQSLITRGLARVQQFTWEEPARKMLALY
jgi:glycosyltransferase involved in cell wall biosynthesis